MTKSEVRKSETRTNDKARRGAMSFVRPCFGLRISGFVIFQLLLVSTENLSQLHNFTLASVI